MVCGRSLTKTEESLLPKRVKGVLLIIGIVVLVVVVGFVVRKAGDTQEEISTPTVLGSTHPEAIAQAQADSVSDTTEAHAAAPETAWQSSSLHEGWVKKVLYRNGEAMDYVIFESPKIKTEGNTYVLQLACVDRNERMLVLNSLKVPFPHENDRVHVGLSMGNLMPFDDYWGMMDKKHINLPSEYSSPTTADKIFRFLTDHADMNFKIGDDVFVVPVRVPPSELNEACSVG